MRAADRAPRSGSPSRLLAALSIGVVLTSCGGAEVVERGGHYVLTGHKGWGTNIAGVGLDGTVRLVGSCLGVDQAVVVWPYGTEVLDDEPLSIDIPSVGTVTAGDRLVGGADELVPEQLPDGIEVPADCSSDLLVAFYPG